MAGSKEAMDSQQAREILQGIQATYQVQSQTLSEVISRLTTLAERLEPLAEIMEQQVANFDGQVQRQETITLAMVRLQKQWTELYQEEKKELEAEQERPSIV